MAAACESLHIKVVLGSGAGCWLSGVGDQCPRIGDGVGDPGPRTGRPV